MSEKELKITRVTSTGGKEFRFLKNDLDVNLMEVEWENSSFQHKDLFEKLIDSSEVILQQLPTTVLNGHLLQSTQPQRQGCKCSKIGCLKLYCQCFSKGVICGPECICSGCENCSGNQKRIELAQQMANFRKPGSFKNVQAYVPLKKCTCKKSQCLKRYCQCHSAGIKCNPSCLCTDCHNKQSPNYFEKGEDYRIEIEVEG